VGEIIFVIGMSPKSNFYALENIREHMTSVHMQDYYSMLTGSPESMDMSDAYNRRMIIMSFLNLFDGKNADPHLLSKLTTEEELTCIFNVCMMALMLIIVNKGLYINEQTIDERKIKYERNVNPVKAFLQEAITEDSTADTKISKKESHDAYIVFCDK